MLESKVKIYEYEQNLSFTGIQKKQNTAKEERPFFYDQDRKIAQTNLLDVINSKIQGNWKLIDIIEYLNEKHGLISTERKKLIRQIYKTLLKNFIPDYMKLILHECQKTEKEFKRTGSVDIKLWADA